MILSRPHIEYDRNHPLDAMATPRNRRGQGESQLRASQVIWVVDDDPSVRSGLSTLLRSFDYDVVTFESAAEVMAHIGETQPDCIVSDVQMPGMSGIELSLRLIENGWRIPTIFITAYPTPELHRQAFANGACALLIKPLGASDLAGAIEAATSMRSG